MPPPEHAPRARGWRATLAAALRDLWRGWKRLALADLAYKVIALVLLTPLVSILLGGMVALSGQSFLADEDILYFFLGPLGWICLVLVGALSVGILAIEQVTLLAILTAQAEDRQLSVLEAVRFAAARALAATRIITRVLVWFLLAAAPFVALASAVYAALLTKYDINYYLANRPPTFLVAVGLGVLILMLLLAVLARLATGWFYALPIVIFEDVTPAGALRASRQRAGGRRLTLLLWIAAWLIGTGLLSTVATGLVVFVGDAVVPYATASLGILIFFIGGILLLWSGLALVVSLLSSIIFATLLFHLYDEVCDRNAAQTLRSVVSSNPMRRMRFNLTGKRIVAGAIVFVAAALLTGAWAIQNVRLQDEVEITAHRGASAVAPDNTLASIKQAIKADADWVEIDVQETGDGDVVVFHDSDFKKVAGDELKIWNATRADLARLDIGSWFAPEFCDQRVPTLSQVLDVCQGKIRLNIELKYYGHNDRLEERVIEIIESHQMAREIVIMSLKNDGLRKIKSQRPNWKVGLLTAVKVGDLTGSEADFLAVNAKLATRDLIQAAHKSGKEIHAWTVNDAVSMSILMGRGVDNIITDKPALGKSVLRQRATLSLPERLLLDVAEILGVKPQFVEL